MKSKYFKIHIDIYHQTVHISIAQSDAELWNRLKRTGMAEKETMQVSKYPDECVMGRAVFFGNGHSLIRLRNPELNPTTHGLISHEVFHIATFILNDVGISLTPESDEAYAYLIDFITKKIYESI